jgi:hypothetical protein
MATPSQRTRGCGADATGATGDDSARNFRDHEYSPGLETEKRAIVLQLLYRLARKTHRA